MFNTTREALTAIRESMGIRSKIWFALLVLLATPIMFFILVFGFLMSLVASVWSSGSWVWGKLHGVGKRLDDPVFGTITYEGSSSWTAAIELEGLHGRLGVGVTGPATGLGPEQHALLRGLVERQRDIGQQVEKLLFKEYQELAPRLRADFASWPLLLESLPPLETSAQIWQLLSDGFIILAEEPGSFSVGWNCTWDEEHGVSMTFRNWQFLEMSN